jgi:hypothetical protein
VKTFGRVGPSVPGNAFPHARLRILACVSPPHRSELLKIDESELLPYESMATKVKR